MLLTTRIGKAATYTQPATQLTLHAATNNGNGKLNATAAAEDDEAEEHDVISIGSDDSVEPAPPIQPPLPPPTVAKYTHNHTLLTPRLSTSSTGNGGGYMRPLITTRVQPTYNLSDVIIKPRNYTAANGAPTVAKTVNNSLVSSLASRLQRGSDYIKDTVAKALNAGAPLMQAPPLRKLSPGVKVSSIGGRSYVTATHTSAASTLGKHAAASAASTSTKTAYNGSTLASITRLQPSVPRYPVPTAAFLKLYTVRPTALHCSEEVRKRTASTDSLTSEMCHFKPIRIAPITTAKGSNKWRSREIKRPAVMRQKPRTDSNDIAKAKEFKPKKCDVLISAHRHLSAFASLRATDNVKRELTPPGVGKSTRKRTAATQAPKRAPPKQTKRARKAAVAAENATARDSIKPPPPPPASRKRKQRSEVATAKAKLARSTPPLTRQRASQMKIQL